MRSRLASLRRAGLLAAGLVACGGGDASEAGERDAPARALAQRIVGGQLSTEALDSAVLLLADGRPSCSGTLLTPNLVLTARHCVASPPSAACGPFQATQPPSRFSIAVGVQAEGTPAVAKATRVFTPPQNESCGADVALLLLDKDVPGAKIAKVRFDGVKLSERVVTTGYGVDGTRKPTPGRFERSDFTLALGPGAFVYTTRSGQQLTVHAAAGDIVTGETTCFGDSGGPLFDAAGSLVGVTSRGIDQECVDRPSIYTGIPAHAALLREAAAASGHALQDASPPAPSTPEAPSTPTSPSIPTTTSTPDDDPKDDAADPPRPRNTGSHIPSSGCQLSAPARSLPGRGGFPALALVLAALLASSRRSRAAPR